MGQEVEEDHENVAEHTLEAVRAYRVLKEGLRLDSLRKKACDELEGVDLADLELQSPAGNVEGRRVGVHLQPRGNQH